MRKTIYASIGFLGFHLYYQVFGDYESDIWKAIWYSALSLMIFFVILDSIEYAFNKSIKAMLWAINAFWVFFFVTEVYLIFNIEKYKELVEQANKWSSGFFLLLGIILFVMYKSFKDDKRKIKR